VARIRWTLGHSAGDHSLAMHLDGIEKLFKITAVARPAAPANLSFDDAPGEKGAHAKGKHLVALVTDAYGNPVPDVRLNFSTKSGSVAPGRAVSDAKGRVKVTWTVGGRPGDQSLLGSVSGSDVRGSFVVPGVIQAGSPAKPHAAPKKTTTSKSKRH
jgi:hypothetical protein